MGAPAHGGPFAYGGRRTRWALPRGHGKHEAPHKLTTWGWFALHLALLPLLLVVAMADQPLDPRAAACPLSTPYNYNGLFAAKNDWTWSGGDQAASIRTRNGATYWLMGDTILGTENTTTGGYNRGWRLVANSILVQRGCSLRRATRTETAIPDPPGSDRYWAMGALEHDGALYVTAQRTRQVDGGLGFEPAGVEIARFTFDGDTLVFRGLTPTPSTETQVVEPQYAGATVAWQGYAYYYGYQHTSEKASPHAAYLARVKLNSLTRADRWEVWDGSRWSRDHATAKTIFDGQPTSAAVLDGKWVVLQKEFGDAGSKVLALVAPKPTGPFTTRVLMDSPARTTAEGRHYTTYSPQLHQAQRLVSGKTLVGISWNGIDLFRDNAADADLYKPRFQEFTLP